MTGREAAARRHALVCVAPTVLALGALTVYPGIWVLWLSLQRRIPIFDVSRFAGFENYAFLAVDPRFWSAHTTAVFTLGSVALEVVLGVAAALAINAQRRGRRVALSLLLLAWAMPAVVGAKLFEWLYHPAAGLINVALGRHSDQLARRSRRGVAGRHPGRRVAHDAVRGHPLLRAAPGDSGRRVRGGAGRRRRPARDLDADHPAAARADLAAGGPVPHPGRAARLRHHVRPDRRRPGRDDRDAHGVRVPGALPDPAAGLRLGGERDRVRPGHDRRVGVLEILRTGTVAA